MHSSTFLSLLLATAAVALPTLQGSAHALTNLASRSPDELLGNREFDVLPLGNRQPLDALPVGKRDDRVVNPAAVVAGSTVCTAPGTTLVSHDINVALLDICGGIAGTIEQCAGNPATTTGTSGTAKFTLTAATAGQTIDITKGRWEACVAAARATCGDSPFTSTCIGGSDVNADNVDFVLASN